MTFINPLLLWGLAAAAVPVVIHLLNRRRFQRQRWAAMEWLLRAAKQTKRRLQMQNLLLLLLRTLAVLFLALALARPQLANSPLAPLSSHNAHLFLLVDNSASMGARSGTRTALEEAVGTATSLLGDNPHPSPDEVRVALSGNLCRCTGYDGIVRAVLGVAAKGDD